MPGIGIGISPAFMRRGGPSPIAELGDDVALWVSARHVTSIDGTVTAVADRSPAGHSLTVSGSPQLTASNADFGGAPTIAPNGGVILTPDLGAHTAHTVFASLKLPTATGANRILLGQATGGSVLWMMSDSASGIAIYDGAIRAAAAANTATCVLAWLHNGSNLQQTWRNGTKIGESTLGNARAYSSGANIFGQGSTSSFLGELHELVAVKRAMTEGEMDPIVAQMMGSVGL
jgi:hypothetical protein